MKKEEYEKEKDKIEQGNDKPSIKKIADKKKWFEELDKYNVPKEDK